MTKQLSVSAHSQPAAQCAGADPAPLRRRSAVAPYSQGCGVTPGSETGKQTIQWTALHSTDSSGPRPCRVAELAQATQTLVRSVAQAAQCTAARPGIAGSRSCPRRRPAPGQHDRPSRAADSSGLRRRGARAGDAQSRPAAPLPLCGLRGSVTVRPRDPRRRVAARDKWARRGRVATTRRGIGARPTRAAAIQTSHGRSLPHADSDWSRCSSR